MKNHWGVWGVIIAVSLCVMAIPMEIVLNGGTFEIPSILKIIGTPMYYLPLLASAIIGFIAYVSEKRLNRQTVSFEAKLSESDLEFRHLESFMSAIESGVFNSQHTANARLQPLLQSLQNKIQTQREEEAITRWSAEGHAQFNDIFRDITDPNLLADTIVKTIVKYVGVNQASLFVTAANEMSESVLELKACYAYERKKYLNKSFGLGEGLVGQCYLENSTMVLTDVPTDYIRITSGLGDSTATFVVLVPIRNNDTREGVLELAAFRPLKPHQIRFVETVCEGFASVLRSAKSTQETKALLDATQHQAEQLRSQEEEIRQNLEEMQATQEELSRQLTEARLLRDRVERREKVMALTTILSETDLHGSVTFVNDKFCEVSKYSREELVGQPHNIVRHPDMPKELFQLFWSTIKRGEVFFGVVKNRAKDGSHYWVDATIVPIKNESGELWKFVGSRYHIKDDELGRTLYNRQAETHGWPLL